MILSSSLLLAFTRAAEVSLKYREGGSFVQSRDLLFIVVPVVAISISFLIYKIADREPAIVNTPQGMLNELCKVHLIDSTGRHLLTDIAEALELEQPATILLSESHFDAAVNKAGKQLNYNRQKQSTIGTLRRRLFK
jgi:hypothetical protein